MTMLSLHPTKADLKASIGKRLRYQETSMFGEEYRENGSFTVAYRPAIRPVAGGKREYFARVTMKDGLIAKVE